MWGSGFWDGTAASGSSSGTTTPQPPTDLTQLLLSIVSASAETDKTQAIVTDYQSATDETLTSSEVTGASSKVGPYTYDEGTHSAWGFAQYA